MKTKKSFFVWLVILLLIAVILACGPVTTVTPTVILPDVTPVTDTPVPTTLAPNITSAPVPTFGPPIQHFTAGQEINITTIRMLTDMEGWGVGGLEQASDHVFQTEDGGLTWRDVTPPQPAPQESDANAAALGFFRDINLAWVVYYPQSGFPTPEFVVVWYTRDGGASWQFSQPLDSSLFLETFYPSDMQFVDGQHGWFLGHLGAGMHHDYVALFATSDGGVSWPAILSPSNDGGIQSLGKTSMEFFDEHTGWLTTDNLGVAEYMPLYYSNDGGLTWQEILLPAPQDSPNLFDQSTCQLNTPQVFSPSSALFALTCHSFGSGSSEYEYFLYATTDSGATWQIQSYPGGQLKFFDEDTGFALARDINKTSDGGQTWTQVKQVNWDGQFNFVNPNIGWAVARNEDMIALVKTTNSGATWQEIHPIVGP